ncbi:MAG: hypothetical protein ACTHLT_06270 [Devosia sp.]
MKIRNLLLGSLAVAGLSTTGAYAADLGVLTSLDVCDSLGLSGLTISSDTNCLQITGEVKYKFTWGDYRGTTVSVLTGAGSVDFIGANGADDTNLDWQSRFDAWIKFVATADSDFGPAKAVLKLKEVNHRRHDNEVPVGTASDGIGSSDTGGVVLDEAYVSIGDSTVIMAGKKGSIMNKGDDEPLNFLTLFNSEAVDAGVSWGPSVRLPDGGHVIQVTSDLGNGLSISAGLEALNQLNTDGDPADFGDAGTAVGVIAYKGEGLSAHATFAAAGVLDGTVEDWGVHAGFAGTFDSFKVVLAGAFGHNDDPTDPLNPVEDYWNVLASASATFDMFTIAASFEAVDRDGTTDFGAGGSVGFAVSDGVALNLGGRWYHNELEDTDSYQVAAQVVASVTETITLTGEVGYVNSDDGVDVLDTFYGSAKLAWAPGGGYTSSIKGTVTGGNEEADAGYKLETEFKKTFE